MERVLLVEGVDDERMVCRLCERLDITEQFCIKKANGVEQLLKTISPELKVPDRLALGILVDANDDPAARWQAIRGRLQGADINPPDDLEPNGTVVEGSPRVGIWMMPDNGSPGELEDFVREMIPKNDSLWTRAERYIDDIPAGERRFKPNKTSRAKLYAWLATRKEPKRMAQALEACDLDTSRPIAEDFAGWLQRTFM
ncbi:MAG: hypothetical protein OXG47_02280 [bacterium]|nr:hypothetical protein [bacterium]